MQSRMKRTLYLLALGVFGIATTEFGVIGILPQIASHFQITVDKAGWLLSAFALVIAVFGPFMTLLFSGVDRKKAMVFVLMVFTISNILSALATNFPLLLFARILPAFLHPVFWSIALSAAAGAVPAADSPKAVGIVFGGFTIASVLGVPLSTFIAAVFNWQASFALCAIVNGFSLLGLCLWLSPMPVSVKATFGDQVKILKKPVLWIQLLLACLMVSAMYASYGYLAVYLNSITRMNGREIGVMLLIFGVAGVGGNWLAGKMLSRNIPLTTIMFILLLSLAHLLLYVAGGFFIPMVMVIIVWGFIHTGGFLISNINVTSAAPESREFVNSIFTSCGNMAVTIGATLGGMTIARAGVQYVAYTSIILLGLAGVVWGFSRWWRGRGI
ncbi:DHA1 family inner membrane transport protein [Chitinophaga sp. W2I13]|uniref:MFS transporter n=1 Tax=Chitinophaga sp. W2I13 TaxID=3373923 RepID=UPI003D204CB1